VPVPSLTMGALNGLVGGDGPRLVPAGGAAKPVQPTSWTCAPPTIVAPTANWQFDGIQQERLRLRPRRGPL